MNLYYGLLFLGCLIASTTASTANSTCSSQMVHLTEENFLIIRGPITDVSASRVIEKLLSLREKDVYLYISSPGGSVFAGLQIVQAMQTLQASGVTVHTVADFAASMGYVIHQYGSQRLVRPWGVLMQHQMSYGVRGNFHNVQSYTRFIDQINTELTKYQASRSNVSSSHFNELTQHDMWLVGQSTVDSNVADCVVDVACDFRSDTYDEEIMTFWGPVQLTFSTCPLISAPLRVRFLDGTIQHEKDVRAMFDANNYHKMISNNSIADIEVF